MRIPPLDPDQFRAEQKAVVGDWSVLNFSRVMAHHPALYRVFVPLIKKVIVETELTARDRELLVLRVLAQCNEHYEASHHVDIARSSGLSAAEIEAINGDGSGLSTNDRWLLRAADDLVHKFCLSDETWDALAARYSIVEMMEVVALVGCYTALAMMTRSFDIQLESKHGVAKDLATLRKSYIAPQSSVGYEG